MKNLVHIPDMGPWQLLAGAEEARLRPFLCPQSEVGCSCYLIETPESLTVIDPGLPEDMAAELHGLLLELHTSMPRPVCIILTHSHADHFRAAGPMLADARLRANVLCHAVAAKRIRDKADETLAKTFGIALPNIPRATALFAGHGAACVYREVLTPHGSLEALALPIARRTALQIYSTPGHTADSLCLRIENAFFCGDMLNSCDEKTRPGFLDGIYTDKALVQDSLLDMTPECQEAHVTSMKMVRWLMDDQNVTDVLPGHGAPLSQRDADKMLRDAE